MTDVPGPTSSAEPGAPGPAQGIPDTGPTEAGETTPRRRPWTPLLGPIARYVRFWGRHRFFGCLGCLGMLALLLPLCLLTLRLGGAVLPRRYEREPLWPLEPVEVNQVGTVMNEPADQVEEYVAGLRAFDAERMWATYNDQVRGELTSRGNSPADLQRGLSQAQAQGARIDQAVQIGNYPLRDGRRYVFYVITRTGFPPNGDTEEIYLIFTLDPAGKILDVT